MKIPLYEIDKKIALGFSCNNNTEEEITRALDPWFDKVDHIFAVEGRYRVPYSPEMLKGPIPPKFGENTHEILDKHYGSEVGSDKLIYVQYYGEEKKKRQQYLDLAGAFHCDALIVFDSDEIILDRLNNDDYELDWNRFYRRIALAHELVENQPALLNMWQWIPNEELWPRQNNEAQTNTWKQWNRIHINPGNQKYILNHYTFAPSNSTEFDIMKFSTNEATKSKFNPYLLYPMANAEGVRFTTDRMLRNKEMNEYGVTYSWQLIHEEIYRSFLLELQVTQLDKLYKEVYREPFTYWFDSKGKIVEYTKEELELFNSLEL